MKDGINTQDTFLGIELGSTRIKAVLIGGDHRPLAMGAQQWENCLENGVWTYRLEDVWTGLQACYRSLAQEVLTTYGVALTTVGAMGISGMMHGYLPFDGDGALLAPFRTWRNTTTGQAAAGLTELFSFHIPQRWSIAHLEQAVLNDEEHVEKIRFLTTLAGYVHWQLTGEKVLGVGEASGMFPIDSAQCDYDPDMVACYDARSAKRGFSWRLGDLLPRVLNAGEPAGWLTEGGARLLDPTGTLCSGIPLCPPEGDAGTGMAATNAVAAGTGNVSAGTSIFAMVVLERALSKVYPELDLVSTPTGSPVAMVHCNNCTTELNAWVALFGETARTLGVEVEPDALFPLLCRQALEGEADCGGVLVYNYHSGEPVAGLAEGRPLLVRGPESRLTLPNLMRAQLFSCLAVLKIGLELLLQEESVVLDRLLGHGGFFKTPVVGQRLMAAALGVPVSVRETAGEGGAWGMALLAAYLRHRQTGETLEHYLENRVFAGMPTIELRPDPEDSAGFETFLRRYRRGLAVERAAVEALEQEE